MSASDSAARTRHDPSPDIAFSRQEWLRLFTERKYEQLCAEFMRILAHFISTIYCNLPADNRAFFNEFVENFLYFFCQPEFKIPAGYIPQFVRMQPVIANVVAMSDFETTTPWVLRLARRKENYFKLLALHNVRSAIDIEPTLLFDVNPFLASQWWNFYWTTAPAFCLRQTHERIRQHLKNLDRRLTLIGAASRVCYFPVTYVAPECEQIAKEQLNRLVAEAFANVSIRNAPVRNKIALATGRWHRSAVYTSLSPLIHSLAGHYDLTLINFGSEEKEIMDRDMFERVICIQMKDHRIDCNPLQGNNFSAVIYPDIGMNPESIYLSNIRIAPVQMVMYGHPASTWGSTIDYFIGGQKVEDLARAGSNYGERLVVIPGMGVYPVYPDDFTIPSSPPQEEPFLVNCAWTAQKVSYPLLAALREILARTRKNIVFQFFPGRAVMDCNGFIPFVKDIQSLLGAEHVRVLPDLPRLTYLAELCRGGISIDSYPFGGFNTVIDALYCGKPMVVWQGDRAFNRFGAATLEIAGMPELIARTREEYIAKIVRLIHDDDFRAAMHGRAGSIDLKAAFARHENPAFFRRAVDFLIDNNDRLKADGSRTPIVIE